MSDVGPLEIYPSTMDVVHNKKINLHVLNSIHSHDIKSNEFL